MNRRGHAGRTDANHTEVVQALLKAGCSVQSLASVGLGCPDLLVGIAGLNVLLEVKNEANIPSKRVLTPEEKKFHQSWKGQVVVVESPHQAVDAIRRCLAKEAAA
jgi:hypothetical protein